MQNFININKFVDIVNLGFFTSKGGISKGDFNSLNCSKSNDDKKNNVSGNIKIALNALGIEKKRLKILNQIHSNKIFFINFNLNFLSTSKLLNPKHGPTITIIF